MERTGAGRVLLMPMATEFAITGAPMAEGKVRAGARAMDAGMEKVQDADKDTGVDKDTDADKDTDKARGRDKANQHPSNNL